jgi:hypothetical protein
MSEKGSRPVGRSRSGLARARALSSTQRSAIAKKAAIARWGAKATHRGNFQREFGIDVDCYVLDDPQKTAVISQRGMGEALGHSKEGSGKAFPRSVAGPTLAPYLGAELIKKLQNPLIFQPLGAGANVASHGYDVTILIDVCKAIVQAEADGKLRANQFRLARQAHVVLAASAKAGIRGLVYALAGYSPSTEEVITAFKLYVQEEARKYEQEFPSELYREWHRLYEIPVPVRGKPWQFKHLTVKHVWVPLAQSNGKILELVRALKARDGDRQKKLFQFLSEIGARALGRHIGRVQEIAETSTSAGEYESRIEARFGHQREFDFIAPPAERLPTPKVNHPNANAPLPLFE